MNKIAKKGMNFDAECNISKLAYYYYVRNLFSYYPFITRVYLSTNNNLFR